MRWLSILLSCLLICCFACTQEKLTVIADSNCPLIAGKEIYQEDQRPCNYNAVYSFKGEIYTHCICCLCNKWAPPVNCAGVPLCSEYSDSCWNEFQEKATYLYAIEAL